MGCFPGKRSSSTYSAPAPALPNPRADQFRVVRESHVGEFTVAEIHYPDCTNYEGRKILLLRAASVADVIRHNGGLLDPHFSDNVKFISPVARFEPSDAGWAMALRLAAGVQSDDQ